MNSTKKIPEIESKIILIKRLIKEGKINKANKALLTLEKLIASTSKEEAEQAGIDRLNCIKNDLTKIYEQNQSMQILLRKIASTSQCKLTYEAE